MDFSNKQVTITGGTGSFGSTMARHLLERGIGQVNIISRDEAKQDDMRRRFADERVKFFIGDVRDRESLVPAFNGSDFAFHAAALKQVPSCEFFPQQAVKTNVVGSDNVIRVAADAGVKTLVCLSTDKAVYPINAMGMSKALMERTAQAYARNNPESETTVAVTRYGNVLFSRGSVLPLFTELLRHKKPITITDPNMTRFHMTLDESVDLVLYAFEHANGGDLFVRKAPASTIDVLAQAVAHICRVENPDIQVIGSRHGEKMHESLLSTEEAAKAEDMGGYYRVPLDARSLQYNLYFDEGQKNIPAEGYTSANTEQLDLQGTIDKLLEVPEMRRIWEQGL